jgi:hypothetical protein
LQGILPGTFHDWSLLLYGTAEPAQPSDQRHSDDAPSATSLLGLATAHVTSQVLFPNTRVRYPQAQAEQEHYFTSVRSASSSADIARFSLADDALV